MENSGETQRAKKEQFNFRDLTPPEHLLVGSTVAVDGIWLKRDTLGSYLKENKDKKNPWRELLIPLSVSNSSREEIKEQVSLRRLKKERLTGVIIVFDLIQLQELRTQGKKPYLELSALNKSGEIQPPFRVGLTDEDGKEIDAPGLRINPGFSQYFTLEEDSNGKNMVLRLVKI